MLYIFYLQMPQRQRFPCTICEKSYCQKGKLNFHVKTSHMPGGDNLTKCLYCEKTFATMVGKARHEAIVHMGRKEYTCDICDKTFGTKCNSLAILDLFTWIRRTGLNVTSVTVPFHTIKRWRSI